MNEAQLFFGSVLVASIYLSFRVLQAGLLGPLSVRYFEWAGRTEERKKLEFAATAEKATLHFKPPSLEGEARARFREQVEQVPIDEATGEAIISGPQFTKWLMETKKALKERTIETIVAFRAIDIYFRDTFCKMTQNLASIKTWKEAQDSRQGVDLEFQDIAEWASKLQSGWDKEIFKECTRIVDEKAVKDNDAQRREMERITVENQRKIKERQQQRISASQKKQAEKAKTDEKEQEEAAKLAEAELMQEEERREKKKIIKKV
jgi:hypothetical protein